MKIPESAWQREGNALVYVADDTLERGGNVLLGLASRDATVVA